MGEGSTSNHKIQPRNMVNLSRENRLIARSNLGGREMLACLAIIRLENYNESLSLWRIRHFTRTNNDGCSLGRDSTRGASRVNKELWR